MALGLGLPGHLLQTMELNSQLILFMLLLAPVGEEVFFRGWLSGRPAHVWAVVILIPASLVLVLSRMGVPHIDQSVGWIVFGGGLILALALAWRGRRQSPGRFFQRHFLWFYLLSTLAFASVHLANFAEGNALILLPLTLPQLLLGLILGYVRVQFGLWAGVLLHAAHNSLFVGLLLAGAG
jgi:membrane protease YdiL (CAAX protease family)